MKFIWNNSKIRKGLYLILTNPSRGYERVTEMAVAESIPVIQLRYKGENMREFLALAHKIRKTTNGTDTKLIINDRVDIALISGADGVHLGQNDLSPENARTVLGDAMVIGLSTHNLDQVAGAQSEPVDYIGFGPVFKPFSKEKHEPVTGVEMLRAAVTGSRIPVVAIGGISSERLQKIVGIPFHNIACIGAIESAENPVSEMREIQRILEKRSFTGLLKP